MSYVNSGNIDFLARQADLLQEYEDLRAEAQDHYRRGHLKRAAVLYGMADVVESQLRDHVEKG